MSLKPELSLSLTPTFQPNPDPITANKAVKRPSTVCFAPVDMFEDTWGYFQ